MTHLAFNALFMSKFVAYAFVYWAFNALFMPKFVLRICCLFKLTYPDCHKFAGHHGHHAECAGRLQGQDGGQQRVRGRGQRRLGQRFCRLIREPRREPMSSFLSSFFQYIFTVRDGSKLFVSNRTVQYMSFAYKKCLVAVM